MDEIGLQEDDQRYFESLVLAEFESIALSEKLDLFSC